MSAGKFLRNGLFAFLISLVSPLIILGQQQESDMRNYTDTVGFAHLSWQMDSIMLRIEKQQGKQCRRTQKFADNVSQGAWRTLICPHDDYAYVGYVYPSLLKNVKAKTLILIGVCHKAKQFGFENKVIFDDFEFWRGPYGKVRISPLRDEVISRLPADSYVISREAHQLEHSLEAIIPFVQYYNKDIEIIPVLIPYAEFDRQVEISGQIAHILGNRFKEQQMNWGEDYCILISSDAVHYGDEDWSGNNYARYGSDSAGYARALLFENEICSKYLEGPLNVDKIRGLSECTVSKDNFREYQWTWCGRYSVPFGLLLSFELENVVKEDQLGYFLCYSTSIANPPIKVDDLRMGVTAPASLRHWVGYAAVGYR